MDYGFIDAALGPDEAFVHVGDRFDATLRYLTRFRGPDRDYAFVYVGGTALLCAPARFEDAARRTFPGDRVLAAGDLGAATAAGRAAEALDAIAEASTLRVPPRVPHDAAVRLEDAGFALASTGAVADARARKDGDEVDAIRRVQEAARRGIERAEAVLARAETDGDAVVSDDGALTTGRLRREVDAALAAEGVGDAANTVVAAGSACADPGFRDDVPIRTGETVLVDASPRGPAGYHGDLARTFVVGGEGGWERRAHVAVEAARDAALAVLDAGAGTPAGRVHEEAAAEVAAHGFPVGDAGAGFPHGTGHGVGMSHHEAPSLRGDAPLRAGNVVTVEPGVYDPAIGGVRIEDAVLVREDGYEVLAGYPRSLDPGERHSSSSVT